MNEEKIPSIGVVIPTFNRRDVLILCLMHLEEQSWKDFEVVVVDDGSTDGTAAAMQSYASRTPLDLRYVQQENSGPAGARNHGITLLRAPVCLMIGDDILATPELVQHHVTLHQRFPVRQAAGLGLTRWSEKEQKVTPFMRWLDEDGVQFAYKELLGGSAPSWKHFYTSNLSLKTEQLRRHPFDERFRGAGMEDIELGFRLAQANELTMHFLPNALGEHVHPTNVSRSCRRLIGVGYAAYDFDQLWPEQARPEPTDGWKNTMRALLTEEAAVLPSLRAVASLLTHIWCPNPLLTRVLVLHYRVGYQRAKAKQNRGGL